MCTLDLTVEIPENIQNMLYQRSLQGPHVLAHEAKLMAVRQPYLGIPAPLALALHPFTYFSILGA